MQAVYDCIEQGKVGIFESPTGTGKSLSLICGSLTWLREHKRKQFDEAMQNIEIEVDEDEPAWMAEHAREAKRRELSALRREFEGRLEGVRERERRTRERERERERVKGGEAGWKRRKVGGGDDGDGGDGEGKGDVEDQFALDDYDSDDDDGEGARRNNNNGQPQYSAETTKLLEKLGMIVPTKDDRKPDDDTEDELKIFFCSRTHSQLSQFVGELQRVHLPAGLPPEGPEDASNPTTEEIKQITLGSRKNLCINPKVNKPTSSQTTINERCMELQQSKTPSDKKCPHIPSKDDETLLLDFKDHALASIRDIEDLANLGRKMGICPYYASRPAVAPAELVTLPYPLLLQKSAREALGISLKGHVVIIDEAHNLMDAVEGICSAQVTLAQLRLARESLVVYLQKFRNRLKGSNRVYVTQVVRVIDSLVAFAAPLESEKGSDGGTVQPGALLAGKGVDQINLTKLVRYISESKLARKVEGYVAFAKAGEDAVVVVGGGGLKKNGHQTQESQPPAAAAAETPTLTQIQNFLTTLMNPSKEGRFFWSKEPTTNPTNPNNHTTTPNTPNSITLRYILLDPSPHFREIVSSARAVILAGGTMSPLEDYRHQLFPYLPPDKLATLSCGHIIPRTSLLVRAVVSDATGALEFNYKTRSSTSTMQRLGEALLAILPKISGGTVVFFASYAYLELVRKQWEVDGTAARISAAKATFWDSRAVSVEATFRAYSEAVVADEGGRGALLFSVIGGKLSEGINFSDSLGRCVVVVGLPFPNVETPEWRAKGAFLDGRAAQRGASDGGQDAGAGGKASREHAENVCMRAVNQAIGRAIRHKGDWASILLFDSRYGQARVQRKLPGWIRESLPEGSVGRVEGVVGDLGRFFEGRR